MGNLDEPVVMVYVSGGVVSEVAASEPAKVVIVDFDTDGTDEYCINIEELDGVTAYVGAYSSAEFSEIEDEILAKLEERDGQKVQDENQT